MEAYHQEKDAGNGPTVTFYVPDFELTTPETAERARFVVAMDHFEEIIAAMQACVRRARKFGMLPAASA